MQYESKSLKRTQNKLNRSSQRNNHRHTNTHTHTHKCHTLQKCTANTPRDRLFFIPLNMRFAYTSEVTYSHIISPIHLHHIHTHIHTFHMRSFVYVWCCWLCRFSVCCMVCSGRRVLWAYKKNSSPGSWWNEACDSTSTTLLTMRLS